MCSKIRVELNPFYKVNHSPRPLEFLHWLRQVDEIYVVENSFALPLAIFVDGRLLGLIDPFDDWESVTPCDEGDPSQRIKDLKPAVIFKYQWRKGVDYPPGTISAGYPCASELAWPADLLTRNRPTEIIARMRANFDYHWKANTEWMIARSQIVYQAALLGRLGRNTKFGHVAADQYAAELWDAQIGFDWRGAGFLTHRIIEYIRAGVVPITRPLGEEWPIREDVILQDGVHCVFCPDPGEFAREASKLMLDRPKIARIRLNLVELWREKLCPAAQGNWIWSKLKAAL